MLQTPATCSSLESQRRQDFVHSVRKAAGSMQFDFDSAMGYGPNQKFTSAGDAVVPSLTPRVSGFSQYPFNMQSAGSAFDKAAYDLPLKPLYEISGACSRQTSGKYCRRWCNRLSDTFVCDAGDGGGSSSSLGELCLSADTCSLQLCQLISSPLVQAQTNRCMFCSPWAFRIRLWRICSNAI